MDAGVQPPGSTSEDDGATHQSGGHKGRGRPAGKGEVTLDMLSRTCFRKIRDAVRRVSCMVWCSAWVWSSRERSAMELRVWEL